MDSKMQPTANLPMSDRSRLLIDTLKSELLILDGAMGTMIQQAGLKEEDFHRQGVTPPDCTHALAGCNDLLCLTRPDVIEAIHRKYIDAGARIIETNSFNSNAFSLSDYGLQDMAGTIAYSAARLARKVADEQPHPVWTAGSVGPTGKSLAMSMAMNDGSVTFDSLEEAYHTQIKALIDGGVDMLLIETVFDCLNAKAAIAAALRAMTECGRRVPVALSVTLTESGRTLSGQTAEAFMTSISHADPIAVGFNCGFGAEQMIPFIERIQEFPAAIIAYPNAGLPNALGAYDQTPEQMAEALRPLMEQGMLNIAGGCCGTEPAHIEAIARLARGMKPRAIPEADRVTLRLAGLDYRPFAQGAPLIKVGERCNVAGSRKFLRLIKEGDHEQALDIVRSQIKAGADIIDINMDDAMLDARREMCSFLDRIGAEPELAGTPVMIDSSAWPVITEALKHIQGRPVVNSISLKEGEQTFIEKAVHIRNMGAAVVVMAFDELGQADTLERRTEICARAYRLLTEKAGMNPSDIIFDPNILTVATGMAEHRKYALDFIRATEWCKSHLPGARISGGLSNLSFAFRGNNKVREAMHAVFLHLACSAGLDMAIINPSTLMSADDVEPALRRAIEDVLLDRDEHATDRLVELASAIKAAETKPAAGPAAPAAPASAPKSACEALTALIAQGATSDINPTVDAAVGQAGSAVAVIEGPLMEGMNIVGERFSRGEMFLPQVVKSAQTMKRAVARLTPLIEKENSNVSSGASAKTPVLVLATVKGDVHDIGKNIVAVVMQCNGFRVIDLGVMVECDDIIKAAATHGADAVGLSGLITPSLSEMAHVASTMEERGMNIPLLVGGAAASAEHTAVKLAPCYSGPVAYTHEAASLPSVARRLINPESAPAAIAELRKDQERLRERHSSASALLSVTEARKRRPALDYSLKACAPAMPGIHDGEFTISELRGLLNVRALFAAWGLDASLAAVADIDGCDHCRAQWLAALPQDARKKGSEAMQLWKEANRMLDAMEHEGCRLRYRVALTGARAEADDIFYTDPTDHTTEYRLPTVRRQTDDGAPCPALADFIDPEGNDHIGLFAVTPDSHMRSFMESGHETDGMFGSMLAETLSHRLAEAAAEAAHRLVRTTLWGFSPDEPELTARVLRADYQGIRPAIGYPSIPDQSLVFLADKVLHYADLDITLTENGAMSPSATVTGYIFGHPEARYFVPGRIADDQRADYARRRGSDNIDKFMPRR